MSLNLKTTIKIFSLTALITGISFFAHAQDILRSPKWQIENPAWEILKIEEEGDKYVITDISENEFLAEEKGRGLIIKFYLLKLG